MRRVRRALDESGQVLPLTALAMTALLLFAALAIDVTNVLSAERFYTTTADAAALAGAQDLQTGITRSVSTNDRQRARTHAVTVLVNQLRASGPPICTPNKDIVDCELPGTPYLVSVKTPSPTAVDVDPYRAVQVTVRHPTFGLTFARLAGQDKWNVESSAVAGLVMPGKFALLALKPDPKYNPGVDLNGSGVELRVSGGDIGTNTHLVESSGAVILEPGSMIHHLNATMGNGKLGFDPPSYSQPISSPIQDPGYVAPIWPVENVPNKLGDSYYDSQSEGDAGKTDCDAIILASPRLTALKGGGKTITCYKPGVYKAGGGNKGFEVQSNKYVAYLTPGVYRFDGGLDVSGYLFGGLIDDLRGVVLSVPDGKELDLESAEQIALNLGDESCVDGDCGVMPALDFSFAEQVAEDGLVMTIYVPREASCFSSGTPIPCAKEPKNATLKLSGTAGMRIAGVVYAPTRNIDIRGNSDTDTIDGQIVGWTLAWSGNSTLSLNYPDTKQLGILRLDAACTGLEACNS